MRAAMALQSSLTEVEWRQCDFTRKSNIGVAVLVCCVCGMCVSVRGEGEGCMGFVQTCARGHSGILLLQLLSLFYTVWPDTLSDC